MFCGSIKLAIELDGSAHYEPEALKYDKVRTEYLESLGIQVLRFPNNELDLNFEGVCIAIANCVNALVGQPPPSADGTSCAKGAKVRPHRK